MKVIGMDIGTTSISSVVMDTETGRQLTSRTIPNDTAVPGPVWVRQQDPEQICKKCFNLVEEYKRTWPDIARIGLTGQMHGMLYVDKYGNAVSLLTTWEDERGNLLCEDKRETYAEYLSDLTGCPMATGYGLTTHFYNLLNDCAPTNAACIATIMDYVGMKLTGATRPVTHTTNAASFGLFDMQKMDFDREACTRAGIDASLLPEVLKEESIIGKTDTGIEVVVAIGDNQAGVLGLVQDPDDAVISIGTSSQISVVRTEIIPDTDVECRPFVEGKYLYLGVGLCGGTSFAMLNRFFCETCELFSPGVDKDTMFGMMMQAAEKEYERETASGEALKINTQFRGTRLDPTLRGSITGITMNNFTPGSMTLGFYRGVCTELYETYQKMRLPEGKGRLLLCGNALRNNPLLRKICEDVFGRKSYLSEQKEEAAIGAARLAVKS
ncbi:MAG: hypothetical protein J6D53_08085 [Blautia sp.]|nr:hypothetical protein [Blautia sp.]